MEPIKDCGAKNGPLILSNPMADFAIHVGSHSAQGVRPNNEDHYLVVERRRTRTVLLTNLPDRFLRPADDTAYVHRVGRTGRAGRSGRGVTFVLPEQQADVSRVARMLGHHEQFASVGMRVAPARKVYTSRRGRRSRW